MLTFKYHPIFKINCAIKAGVIIIRNLKHVAQQLSIVLIAALFALTLYPSAQSQGANPVKSKNLERQARHFLSIIHNSTPLSDDLQINAYVSNLAKKLAAGGKMDSDPLHYFVAANPDINAFAGPGATFFMNTGLIELTTNEGELASVIAHELAHFKQDHLNRLTQKYSTNQAVSLLTVLAGIFIGGDAATAAIVGSQAAQVESIIDNTLVFEREADAIGIQILADSGYSPIHARDFLYLLERKIHEGGLVQSNIHNTHPITPERIASIEGRLRRYPPDFGTSNSDDFYFTRARIKVLYNWDPIRTQQIFDRNQTQLSGIEQLAARYGYALSLMQNNELDSARQAIDQLRTEYPDNLWFELAATEIELRDNKPTMARQILKQTALSEQPSPATVEFYTTALMQEGNLESANRYLRKFLKPYSEYLKLYKLHGQIAVKSGDMFNGYVSLSDYNFLSGNLNTAKRQLTVAQDYADSSYSTAIVREKMRVVEEEIAWRKGK